MSSYHVQDNQTEQKNSNKKVGRITSPHYETIQEQKNTNSDRKNLVDKGIKPSSIPYLRKSDKNN